jgi:uncharacterized protein DUF3224
MCAGHTNSNQKETVMTGHASGTFDVKLTPQAEDDKSQEKESENLTMGRMAIDKQYHGDIEGTGKGQMLTAGTPVKDSAGYVAIERVSGSVQGRKGSFLLQHTGTMNRGVPQLSITVVPDSGTEELVGLAGKLTIKIEGGKHYYDFDYTLAEAN